MATDRFTWVDFYVELADKLIAFKDDRSALISKIVEAYASIGMSLPKLDSDGAPTDIDPFTVYGLFNKGLTEANRRKIIGALAGAFGVSADVPTDFDGVPLMNNLNATFYAFSNNSQRRDGDVDRLWTVFEAALALASEDTNEARESFIRAYDEAAAQYSVGWRLTMGLFWIRPHRFVNLDSRNRWYLGDMDAAGRAVASVVPRAKSSKVPLGEEYLAICDTVYAQLGTEECSLTSFPALSHEAFEESERDNAEKKAAGEDGVLKSKYIPLMIDLHSLLRDRGGQLLITDAYGLMAQEKGYSDEELKQGGALGWARNYLAEAGYIDRSDEAKYRGVWRLTEAGWEINLTPEEASRVIRMKNAKRPAKVENALGDAEVETQRCWVYSPGTGAHLWDELLERGEMTIGWEEIGDLSTYPTKDAMKEAMREIIDPTLSFKNAAHATWQFAKEMRPGDIVYAKRGMREVIGRGVVTSDYRFEEGRGEDLCNVRSVEWTHVGSWSYLGQAPMKTLTDITPYTQTCAHLKAVFEEEDGVGDVVEVEVTYPAYSKSDFLDEVFMDEREYDVLAGLLKRKKNVILQGAPGVGKTFAAKRLAYSIMGEKDVDRVMMVQFHQSYSYEDFIEGFRPSENSFVLSKGAFYEFCKKAEEDEGRDYFFIIDEINRGNLSKIFGELFMLIEGDKRGPRNKLQLLYSRELFYVPANVHLIGMMNTADRSLAMLDYALRRRFAFFDLKPGFGSAGFAEYRSGLGSAKFDGLVACVERLNAAIASDESLGEGFCIGHSYFCGMDPDEVDEAKLSALVEYELAPMLKEYWFDEPLKVRDWVDALRRSVK